MCLYLAPIFTFERKKLLSVSLADLPFAASGCFAEAFAPSFGVGFCCWAASPPLISILGGSGGGGGGIDIPLAAAGGSGTCATYSIGGRNHIFILLLLTGGCFSKKYFPPVFALGEMETKANKGMCLLCGKI